MSGANARPHLDDTATQARRIYIVLCLAYVASQFFRVSNAVIAPELMRTLSIAPEAMGIITGAYFLAFGIMQLPTGVLLDRIGPRWTMSVLLALAAIGSGLFALSDDVATLTAARAIIGVGCAAGLMGSMVVIARWYSDDRFASLSSLLFSVGGIGILMATTPLAAATAWLGWRGSFWVMAIITMALVVLLWAVVRDAPSNAVRAHAPEKPREIIAGLKAVLCNRGIWHCCAVQFVTYASVLAVGGLWAGPYLNDVHGLSGVARGNTLLAINLCTLIGVMGYAVLERWIGSRKWTILLGAGLSAATLWLLALVPDLSLYVAVALLCLFCLVSGTVMLIHSHARALLPDHLVGRGLTFQNVSVFVGVSVMQWASGAILSRMDVGTGTLPEAAYRDVFAFLAVVTLLAALLYAPIRDVVTRKANSPSLQGAAQS